MKLRETINNKASKFTGEAYEDKRKIIVKKSDNRNWNGKREVFEFDTIADYENWKSEQKWIERVIKVGDFKKVSEK